MKLFFLFCVILINVATIEVGTYMVGHSTDNKEFKLLRHLSVTTTLRTVCTGVVTNISTLYN